MWTVEGFARGRDLPGDSTDDQSINPSIYQSINPSIHQSINSQRNNVTKYPPIIAHHCSLTNRGVACPYHHTNWKKEGISISPFPSSSMYQVCIIMYQVPVRRCSRAAAPIVAIQPPIPTFLPQ